VVDRMIDWASSPRDKSHISDDSIRLCGITLAWFLTTSNRRLRDKTTKALVALLQRRVHILRRIIKRFLNVNDPYVLERLLAVAYGCATRSSDHKSIGELANNLYEWIFKEAEPPVHILIRDYARGVIELALHHGVALDIDVRRIRPPYSSKWPSFIPSSDELEKYGEVREGMSDEEWARVRLFDSVMGRGDFARYILGTNFRYFDWSSSRLDEVIDSANASVAHENPFDLSIAQRWILKKVFDLGWSVQRFGRFDRMLTLCDGRTEHKPERIGKKYQWIAYHELLARISDNFEFCGDILSGRPKRYDGPWQRSGLRDIDPTCLLYQTKAEKWLPPSTWWFPSSYGSWDSERDDVVWIKRTEDLPSIPPLIEVTDPSDGSKWLVMEIYCAWESPNHSAQEGFSSRWIHYLIKSYITSEADIETLHDWAKKRNFMGRWMPESSALRDVFLGEMYWSPAYHYHSREGWTDSTRHEMIPRKILVSATEYAGDSFNDCSIDGEVRMYLPCEWLVDQLKLNRMGGDGRFFDPNGNLTTFDPSVTTPGPMALLIRKDILLDFLKRENMNILWTVLGEKGVRSYGLTDGWKGTLLVNGAYRIRDEKVEGAVSTHFLSPNIVDFSEPEHDQAKC